MSNLFSTWQPRYAAHGIATFPVCNKRPAVRGYLKMGLIASERLAVKFPTANAFGLACRKSGITVVDVDSPDERLLADALNEFGATPLIIRSGSGNFQAWYRNSGEKRAVRPDVARPIDILGDGYVVAPPSSSLKGCYEIIEGSLDDLHCLPPLRHKIASNSPKLTTEGKRNDLLWRECMMHSPQCIEITDLMKFAMAINETKFRDPLPDEEVLRVVASAWRKNLSGNNWFGKGGRVTITANEIDDLLFRSPDAFNLLLILRRHHWGKATFRIANAMAQTMPSGGWTRQRFAAARQKIIDIGEIEVVRPPSSFYGPGIYKFKVSKIGHP